MRLLLTIEHALQLSANALPADLGAQRLPHLHSTHEKAGRQSGDVQPTVTLTVTHLAGAAATGANQLNTTPLTQVTRPFLAEFVLLQLCVHHSQHYTNFITSSSKLLLVYVVLSSLVFDRTCVYAI